MTKEYYKQCLLIQDKYLNSKKKKPRKKFIKQELKKRYRKDKFIIFEAIEEMAKEKITEKINQTFSNFSTVSNFSL